MKDQKETQALFTRMSKEEKDNHLAVGWYNDGEGFISFGAIGYDQIELTEEQISQLSDNWQERAKKHLNECNKKGCTLLAGEETEVIYQGTLSACKREMSILYTKDLPLDEYSGKGCWVIVDGDGNEIMSGFFNREMAW
jgi:hypothetical protein